ncbi:MAG: cytochrome c3 family protein [Thermodesulfobacteriota bacterium]
MKNRSLPAFLPGPTMGRVLLLAALFLLPGCSQDPVREHALKTIFFDGVPALPSLEKLCSANLAGMFGEYYESRISESVSGAEDAMVFQEGDTGSIHPPFKQKNCLGCHDFTKQDLLLLPANKLCFKCHKDFIKGTFVHGPVAVAACLACHYPHTSANPSLLKLPRNELCPSCHQERRQAEAMHVRVIDKGMFCVDCHDPHSGNVHFFLK